jgi:hypothetical protein
MILFEHPDTGIKYSSEDYFIVLRQDVLKKLETFNYFQKVHFLNNSIIGTKKYIASCRQKFTKRSKKDFRLKENQLHHLEIKSLLLKPSIKYLDFLNNKLTEIQYYENLKKENENNDVNIKKPISSEPLYKKEYSWGRWDDKEKKFDFWGEQKELALLLCHYISPEKNLSRLTEQTKAIFLIRGKEIYLSDSLYKEISKCYNMKHFEFLKKLNEYEAEKKLPVLECLLNDYPLGEIPKNPTNISN